MSNVRDLRSGAPIHVLRKGAHLVRRARCEDPAAQRQIDDLREEIAALRRALVAIVEASPIVGTPASAMATVARRKLAALRRAAKPTPTKGKH